MVFIGWIRVKRFGRIGWIKVKNIGDEIKAEDKDRWIEG